MVGSFPKDRHMALQRMRRRLFYSMLVFSAVVYISPIVKQVYFQSSFKWNICGYPTSYGDPIQSAKCDSSTVHLALVVGGAETTRQLVILIKSILYHTVHSRICQYKPGSSQDLLVLFHLIVDKQARLSLESLLPNWRLPRIQFTFYDFELYKDQISWIRSDHHSGIFGCGKLLLPEILPDNLTKVIVLDTDLLLHADIRELWTYFSRFSSVEVFGMTTNQSPWYKKNSVSVWPAIEFGFNTGVMLLDLYKMRALNWKQMWRVVASEELQIRKSVVLADQDIVNAVLVRHPQLIYTLPCEWNLQINEWNKPLCCPVQELFNTNVKLSTHLRPKVKITHLNSRQKAETLLPGQMLAIPTSENYAEKNQWRKEFIKLYHMYRGYDTSWFKNELSLLTTNAHEIHASSPIKVVHAKCAEFEDQSRPQRRVHPFYLPYNFTETDQLDPETTVTLLSQMNFERIHRLEELVSNWPGPISISLYLTEQEAQRLSVFVAQSNILSNRSNVGYHVMFVDGPLYPINELRNLALSYARTDVVFHLDIDFVPSTNLYTALQELIKRRWSNANSIKNRSECFVVPAFETFDTRTTVPSTKQTLLDAWDERLILPFRHRIWTRGHLATNYTKWRNATSLYQVQWSADYEPYLVIHRSAPLFDPRFVGFGWNKASYIMKLDAAGYQMYVLPDAFVLHLPHPPSVEVLRYRSSPLYRYCIDKMKLDFIKDLAKEHGVQALKYLEFRKLEPRADSQTN
ncbi:LARG2 [Fasciola hepatica]|uniref:LARG2 n=1 Tax=Fasciola hepatica TaxID=6192 RepID=A0A4E0RW94_FASHE|nr:LARG2 [Fasciola hepatica]